MDPYLLCVQDQDSEDEDLQLAIRLSKIHTRSSGSASGAGACPKAAKQDIRHSNKRKSVAMAASRASKKSAQAAAPHEDLPSGTGVYLNQPPALCGKPFNINNTHRPTMSHNIRVCDCSIQGTGVLCSVN